MTAKTKYKIKVFILSLVLLIAFDLGARILAHFLPELCKSIMFLSGYFCAFTFLTIMIKQTLFKLKIPEDQ